MGIQRYLISARFFVTIGHFTALLLLFQIIENNVNASLGDNASETAKYEAVQISMAALVFGIICFLFDFCGLFLGTSIFYNTVNMVQILFHFIGSLLLSWLITETWNYKALWPIVICTNLPTALVEVAVLIGIYVLKILVY
jgi:hypothetical protein